MLWGRGTTSSRRWRAKRCSPPKPSEATRVLKRHKATWQGAARADLDLSVLRSGQKVRTAPRHCQTCREAINGRSEVLRSSRHYLRAQSQGQHTTDRLEERGWKEEALDDLL